MTTEALASLFGHSEQEPPPSDLAAAGRAYLSARQEKEDVEAILGQKNATLRRAEEALLKAFDQAGVKSMKLDMPGGKPVLLSASTKKRYSLPTGALDDSAFYSWLLRVGGHDLVKRNIHHATFSSWCREIAEAGKTVHPSIEVFEQRLIQLRRE